MISSGRSSSTPGCSVEPPIAIFDPPGLAFFRLGDTRLLVGGRRAECSRSYLRVDDVRVTVAQLRAERFHDRQRAARHLHGRHGHVRSDRAPRSGWHSSPTARATSSGWPARTCPSSEPAELAGQRRLHAQRASSISIVGGLEAGDQPDRVVRHPVEEQTAASAMSIDRHRARAGRTAC